MAVKLSLTRIGIVSGRYRGMLTASPKGQQPPQLIMQYLGSDIGMVKLEPEGMDGDAWHVSAEIPAEYLQEGVHTFLFLKQGDTEVLDRFSMVIGEPLEHDIQGELDLLRAELDLLKKAFRRHCAETM